MGLLSALGILVAGIGLGKDHYAAKHSLSANHWNNKDALHQDNMNPDITPEQIMKNAQAGKYYSAKEIPVNTDHRAIVDRKRYEYDLEHYGYTFAERQREAGTYSWMSRDYY